MLFLINNKRDEDKLSTTSTSSNLFRMLKNNGGDVKHLINYDNGPDFKEKKVKKKVYIIYYI